MSHDDASHVEMGSRECVSSNILRDRRLDHEGLHSFNRQRMKPDWSPLPSTPTVMVSFLCSVFKNAS